MNVSTSASSILKPSGKGKKVSEIAIRASEQQMISKDKFGNKSKEEDADGE